MKNRLYIIMIAVLVLATSLVSCSDWFDISPKTDVKAEELFETENGFMSSLAGIYISMTKSELYGKDLTFGLIDQLVQYYDYIPDGANESSAIYSYEQTTSYGYNTKGRMETTWENAYNIIANANNLLKWLDDKGDEVIADPDTRNMIRGEALAIRAYLHFDLLRCWGPVNYAGNVENQSVKSIPYRKAADKSKQPLLAASKIVELVESDLLAAKDLLSYEKDIELISPNDSRRFRFNYHAINATLARVYNYAGNYEMAAQCAMEVIDGCGLELQSSSSDPILFNEVLMGINLYQMADNLSGYFDDGDKIESKHYISFATLNRLFEIVGAESADMRTKSTAFTRNGDMQMAITKKYIKNDHEVIPLIRLPEMYYILCEAADDASESAYNVNYVRNKRGISSSENVSCETVEQRLEALDNEYRKEFYAEGQYFYFLKSHGLTGALKHRPEISLGEEEFVFPLPDREKEYGWSESVENEDIVNDSEISDETSDAEGNDDTVTEIQ